VAAVVAYHLGYGWAQGGLLGVGVFFTLSGYLITDILAGQWAARGKIGLGNFWLRRARRLLPALFVMLAVVTVWVGAFARSFVPGFRGDAIASVFYVSNWWYIGQHSSYYARFAPPGPLDHLWSLAVEEQFYLVWPWVVLLLAWSVGVAARRRRGHAGGTGRPPRILASSPCAVGPAIAGPTAHGDGTGGGTGERVPRAGGGPYLSARSRLLLAAVTLGLAAVSAVLMAVLYQPGYDPTRVYEGTDTRAFGLLIGAAVAMVWPTRRPAHAGAGGATGAGGARACGAWGGGAWGGGAWGGGAWGGGAWGGGAVPAAVRWLLDAAGVAGLAVIGLLVWRTNQYSDFMFRGGLVLLSLATAAVVAAVVTPGSVLGRALGIRPLRWIGVRSYGIYLWHYPLIVLTATAGGAGGPVGLGRAVVLVAATVAVAATSWQLIEEPVRRGARPRRAVRAKKSLASNSAKSIKIYVMSGAGVASMTGEPREPGTGGGGPGRPRRPRLPGLPRTPQALAGLCLLTAALLAAGVTAATRLSSPAAHAGAAARPSASAGNSTATARLSNSGGRARTAPAATPGMAATAGPGTPSAVGTTGAAGQVMAAAAGPAATVAGLPTPPPRTSCTSVVHIGDSTSEGLISADYLPNPADRITARYADVGVRTSVMKIVGATSIIESLPGTPNAGQMAAQVKRDGFHGCWVLALGTNDTADVFVGSNVGREQRIEKMMALIGSQPVMWVEVTSLLSSGPYAEQNMQLWNQALQRALPRYPSMRVYDWPAVAQKSWFISDGIHYTTNGYQHRAVAIADALAEAFPAS
jgi:peptidoglycan/LPS O-acetylase OafA/YrhL